MKLLRHKKQAAGTWILALLLPLLLYISAPTALAASTSCAAGQHQYSQISRVEATATRDGAIRFRCTFCGHEYAEILFATEHLWGEWITDKAPTCTEPGKKHRTCKRAQSHEEYAELPAHGHDYIESVTAEPGCETAGVKRFSCSRCGENHTETIPAIGHKYVEKLAKQPSCFDDGMKTFICEHDPVHTYTEAIPATLGHEFGEWYVEKEAAQGVTGVEAQVCARDGFKQTREIPALAVKEDTAAEDDVVNTADIVLIGADAALAGAFALMIRPYTRCIRYIKKRRKTVQRLKQLREMVEKMYDFK